MWTSVGGQNWLYKADTRGPCAQEDGVLEKNMNCFNGAEGIPHTLWNGCNTVLVTGYTGQYEVKALLRMKTALLLEVHLKESFIH